MKSFQKSGSIFIKKNILVKIISTKELSDKRLECDIAIESNLHQKLKQIAKDEKKDIEEIIIQALDEFIEKNRKKEI